MARLAMVQIDVPIAFVLGVALALTARRALLHESCPVCNPVLYRAVTLLSLTLVPVCLYFLWAFPYWDTMYMVEPSHEGCAAGIHWWLPVCFVFALPLFGGLGFMAAHALLLRDRARLAWGVAAAVLLGIGAHTLVFLDRALFVSARFEAYRPGVEPNFFSSPLLPAMAVVCVVLGVPLLGWMLCHRRRREPGVPVSTRCSPGDPERPPPVGEE